MIEHLMGLTKDFPATLRVDVTLQPAYGALGKTFKEQPVIGVDATGIMIGEFGEDVHALPWSAIRMLSVVEC